MERASGRRVDEGGVGGGDAQIKWRTHLRRAHSSRLIETLHEVALLVQIHGALHGFALFAGLLAGPLAFGNLLLLGLLLLAELLVRRLLGRASRLGPLGLLFLPFAASAASALACACAALSASKRSRSFFSSASFRYLDRSCVGAAAVASGWAPLLELSAAHAPVFCTSTSLASVVASIMVGAAGSSLAASGTPELASAGAATPKGSV